MRNAVSNALHEQSLSAQLNDGHLNEREQLTSFQDVREHFDRGVPQQQHQQPINDNMKRNSNRSRSSAQSPADDWQCIYQRLRRFGPWLLGFLLNKDCSSNFAWLWKFTNIVFIFHTQTIRTARRIRGNFTPVSYVPFFVLEVVRTPLHAGLGWQCSGRRMDCRASASVP